MDAGETVNEKPACASNSRRRGEAEARTSIKPIIPKDDGVRRYAFGNSALTGTGAPVTVDIYQLDSMITAKRVSKGLIRRGSKAIVLIKGKITSPTKFCTACEAGVADFYRYGDNAMWGCPRCNASPRERLMRHLLDCGMLQVPAQGAILHIAPSERSLVRRFRQQAAEFVPADLYPQTYSLEGVQRLDLMELDDINRFDVIYASHVMEHVPDDKLGFRNIYRALKAGGEAWVMVPLAEGKKTEDGSFEMSVREREKRFGQWDHVRMYGMDIVDRITEAGFTVQVINADSIDEKNRRLFGLADDKVFVCRKSAA